jgi:hypothetical protein
MPFIDGQDEPLPYTAEDAYLETCKEARKSGQGAWSSYYHTLATEAFIALPLPQNRIREANQPNNWYADWVPVYPSEAELRAETDADNAYYDRMEAEYAAEMAAHWAAEDARKTEHHVCTLTHGSPCCIECGS